MCVTQGTKDFKPYSWRTTRPTPTVRELMECSSECHRSMERFGSQLQLNTAQADWMGLCYIVAGAPPFHSRLPIAKAPT